MTFVQQFARAMETEFQRRVLVAAVKSAMAITSESSATTNHANRVAYARAVANSPESHAFSLSLAVAANVAINDDSVDSDIEFSVAAAWDTLAGITVEPPP